MEKEGMKGAVERLLQPVIDENGFELADVEVVKEGPHRYIRLYIDKQGGISIDDCQLVSEALDDLLEKANLYQDGDMLEVSSFGERPFKNERDYARYRGENVKVRLYQAEDGNKEFEGFLDGLFDNKVVITDSSGKKLAFEKGRVASVKRYFKI